MGEACSRCGHRTGIDGPSPAPSDTRQVLHSIRRARRCNRASQETRPWSSDTSTMAVGWIRAVHRCAEAYRGGARGQAAPNLTGSVGSLLVAGSAAYGLEAGPCLARDLPCHQPCLHTAHRGTRPYQKVRRAISYLPATRANVVAPTLPLDSAVAGSGFAVRRHTVGVVFQLAH